METITLYKYKALEGKEGDTLDHTISLLKNGEIYFSPPSKFNDPFDCSIRKIKIDDISDDEINAFTEKNCHEVKGLKGISPSDFRTRVPQLHEFDEYMNNDHKKDFRIYCLSKENDSLLMWSHYANSHRGICIGLKAKVFGSGLYIKCKENQLTNETNQILKLNGIPPDYLTVSPVVYDNNMPKPYNWITNDYKKTIPYFLLTKAKCWDYEKEYRIILHKENMINNYVAIRTNKISEIYFGLNTDKTDKEKILEVIDSLPNKENIIIYEMSKAEGKYQIIPKKIDYKL